MGVEILVPVERGGTGSQPVEVKVAGGASATPPITAHQTVSLGGPEPSFGVESYELRPEDEHGNEVTQAGAHPFQLTTTLDLNEVLENNEHSHLPEETAPALPRNLHFVLPPGLLGNINVAPQCSSIDFSTITNNAVNLCGPKTAVGVAQIKLNEPSTFAGIATETVPIFNLVPAAGEPARFGIELDKVPVVLTTRVRTGSDYAVEVTATNTTQVAALLATQVTFWGVPGDPRHDLARGWECVGTGELSSASTRPARASH